MMLFLTKMPCLHLHVHFNQNSIIMNMFCVELCIKNIRDGDPLNFLYFTKCYIFVLNWRIYLKPILSPNKFLQRFRIQILISNQENGDLYQNQIRSAILYINRKIQRCNHCFYFQISCPTRDFCSGATFKLILSVRFSIFKLNPLQLVCFLLAYA